MKEKLAAVLQWIAMLFRNLWLKARRWSDREIPVIKEDLVQLITCPIVNIGDTAINPEWRWVKVENPKGRPTGNGFHDFGESAGIKAGATLTVVVVENDSVLVSYQSPRGQGYGSEAGNGTLFFVPKRTFANMSQVHALIQEETEARKTRVRELLRQASAQVTESAPPTATQS